MAVKKCARGGCSSHGGQRTETVQTPSPTSTFPLSVHNHQRKEPLMGPEPCESVSSKPYNVVQMLAMHLEAAVWFLEIL